MQKAHFTFYNGIQYRILVTTLAYRLNCEYSEASDRHSRGLIGILMRVFETENVFKKNHARDPRTTYAKADCRLLEHPSPAELIKLNRFPIPIRSWTLFIKKKVLN
uniref:Uncharacterized protein n=1 Tax=Cacopsylla melanoneura TaxID=428564 RepID=A0A8D8ZDG8_9HEMI